MDIATEDTQGLLTTKNYCLRYINAKGALASQEIKDLINIPIYKT